MTRPVPAPLARPVRRMRVSKERFETRSVLELTLYSEKIGRIGHPVAVVSLAKEDFEALVEKAAEAICLKDALYPLDYCAKHFPRTAERARISARAVLRSVLGKAK